MHVIYDTTVEMLWFKAVLDLHYIFQCIHRERRLQYVHLFTKALKKFLATTKRLVLESTVFVVRNFR